MSESFKPEATPPVNKLESIRSGDTPLSERLREVADFEESLTPNQTREIAGLVAELEQQIAEWEQIAYIDPLTDLPNRRAFDAGLEKVWNQTTVERLNPVTGELEQRPVYPISIIAIDIDEFKTVNDTYGHQIGDEYLKIVADVLRNEVRETDIMAHDDTTNIFARHGGDEFIVALLGSTEQSSATVAERVRIQIEERADALRAKIAQERGVDDSDATFSVSIGVATHDKETSMTPQELQKRADYVAFIVKEAGKQGVWTYSKASEIDTDGLFAEKMGVAR